MRGKQQRRIVWGVVAIAIAAVAFGGYTFLTRGTIETYHLSGDVEQCDNGFYVADCVKGTVGNPDGRATSFDLGEVDGFEPEPGHDYVVKIRARDILGEVPEDASSVEYHLIETISDTERS